jgi:hypothetical protein
MRLQEIWKCSKPRCIAAAAYICRLPVPNRACLVVGGLALSVAICPKQIMMKFAEGAFKNLGKLSLLNPESLASRIISTAPKGYISAAARCALGLLGIAAIAKFCISKDRLFKEYTDHILYPMLCEKLAAQGLSNKEYSHSDKSQSSSQMRVVSICALKSEGRIGVLKYNAEMQHSSSTDKIKFTRHLMLHKNLCGTVTIRKKYNDLNPGLEMTIEATWVKEIELAIRDILIDHIGWCEAIFGKSNVVRFENTEQKEVQELLGPNR